MKERVEAYRGYREGERAGLGIRDSILTVISTAVGFEPHREWTNKEIMVYEAAAL